MSPRESCPQGESWGSYVNINLSREYGDTIQECFPQARASHCPPRGLAWGTPGGVCKVRWCWHGQWPHTLGIAGHWLWVKWLQIHADKPVLAVKAIKVNTCLSLKMTFDIIWGQGRNGIFKTWHMVRSFCGACVALVCRICGGKVNVLLHTIPRAVGPSRKQR